MKQVPFAPKEIPQDAQTISAEQDEEILVRVAENPDEISLKRIAVATVSGQIIH